MDYIQRMWRHLDLDSNELRNFSIQKLPEDPDSPIVSQIWYNTTEAVHKTFDGVSIKNLGQLEFDVTATQLRYRPVGTSAWIVVMTIPKRAHVHEFSAAITVLVDHNMGKYPSVTVVDSALTECEAGVEHLDENMLRVTMSAPMSGKIFCN